ncbi:MAG: hypothetical protein WC343_10890 [Bacilli bacterium]|jgi:hypothetical protein
MTATTLSVSDLQRLKSDPRFTPSAAVLLDIMIRQGEVIIEAAPDSLTQPAPQGVQV